MSTPASAIKPLHALRVLQLMLAALQAFACLLCLLLAAGAIVMAVCWATPYRIPALVVVPGAYALGAGLAWRRLRSVAARGKQSFLATRTELAADLELLRSRL